MLGNVAAADSLMSTLVMFALLYPRVGACIRKFGRKTKGQEKSSGSYKSFRRS
jgi:hypothetical protein